MRLNQQPTQVCTLSTPSDLLKHGTSQEEGIIKLESTATEFAPAYFVAADHGAKEVVVGVRGTDSFADLLTDLMMVTEPYNEHHVHMGVLRAAR